MIWFWTWLQWHLLARGHRIPKRLQKYAQPDVAEYVAALRANGINPLSHNPFTSGLPSTPFLKRYREGVRYHGLKYVPQSRREINLAENRFGDIQYMIATTLEEKRGNVFCPRCNASVHGKAMTKRIEDYHGAGGRSFWCDKGHPLFYTMDWIS